MKFSRRENQVSSFLKCADTLFRRWHKSQLTFLYIQPPTKM